MSEYEQGWIAHQKLILHRLDSLDEKVEKLDDSVTLVRLDVVGLKVRASIWGAIAGTIPSLLVVVIPLLLSGGGAQGQG